MLLKNKDIAQRNYKIKTLIPRYARIRCLQQNDAESSTFYAWRENVSVLQEKRLLSRRDQASKGRIREFDVDVKKTAARNIDLLSSPDPRTRFKPHV